MNPIHPPPPAAPILPIHRPNPPPPPPQSLAHVLSDLSHLLHLSATALHSLPTSIHAPTSTAATTFVPCPFNPNHRLPPSSLFSHYLNCPSPISLPHSLHCDLTLRSSSSNTAAAPPALPAESSEIAVSLDNYIGCNVPANNFFYQNCPGPVTPTAPPPSSFNLPRILCNECADFNKESPLQASMDIIRFLPSEIWAIRGEVESWGGGCPAVYSSRILRAILKLKDRNLLHLYDWVIANSPRYGVIIDCAMRDHVVMLVKLCLKVIVGEAHELAGLTPRYRELNDTRNVLLDLRNRSFECPILIKVIAWLASQLSVLYGEVNGKYLAVDMLKECISNTAFHASLFPLEGKDDELKDGENAGRNVEEQVQSADNTERGGRESIESKTVGNSMIFISEVAAAVAALYERCLIEEKIKDSRYARPLSAYQRNLEHAHVSKIADEERQKRPDYRPVVEYDGFLRHRSSNQDANKVKTREELLAEERDYKRRRMSYRGKKLKRNTVEVMREIIEEHMEEMRQAGGVGGMSKTVEETEALASENMDRHSSATNASRSRRNSEIPEDNRGRLVDYRKDVVSSHYSRNFKDDNRQPRQDASQDHGYQFPNRSTRGIHYDRDDDICATRDGRQIKSHSREQLHGRAKSDIVEAFADDDSRRPHQRLSGSKDKYYKSSRDEHEQKPHNRRRDEDDRNSHKKERSEDYWEHEERERSKSRASRERYEDKGRDTHKRKSKSNRNSSSRHELYEFEDRYDPAVS